MNSRIVAFTTLLASLSLALPVTAQIQRPSQEFFEEGREQLERELQILQLEPIELEAEGPQDPNLEEKERPQDPNSEPLLEVQPAPPSGQPLQLNELQGPLPQPSEVDNRSN